MHGQRGQWLQAVARIGRATGFLSRLRSLGPVLRHRCQHGRLSSDPVPAHDGSGQGRGEADRGRSAAQRHGGQGQSVHADQARYRPGPAQWPAAPAGEKRPYRPGLHRGVHRRLGRHARVPRRLSTADSRAAHRHPRGGHPSGRRMDRPGRRVDELLDHGPQSKHPRHLEHQCPVQPAPGHRGDLPAGQRAVFPDRATECHGRSRNGLHGPRFAGAAFGAGRGRSGIHRRPVGHPAR